MMKRIMLSAISAVLVLCLISCSFGKAAPDKWVCESCGEESAGNFCNNCASPKPEIQAEENDSRADDSGSTGENNDKTDKDPQPPETDADSDAAATPFSEKAGIEQTVLVDENGVMITADSLEYTLDYVILKLTIQNNTEDELNFVSGSLGYSCNAINNYMSSELYVNEDVQAGKKAVVSIKIDKIALEIYGIREIAKIDIGFRVSKGYDTILETGPRSILTSLSDTYDYSLQGISGSFSSAAMKNRYSYSIDKMSSDRIEIADGVSLISSIVATNKSGEKILLMEIENTTDTPCYFSSNDIAVNGITVQTGCWDRDFINPHTRCLHTIQMSSVLKEYMAEIFGIDKTGEITVQMKIENDDGDDIDLPHPLDIVLDEGNISGTVGERIVYDSNNIRIYSVGIIDEKSTYSMSSHIVLYVCNNTSGTITIDDDYDSLSVNGIMADYYGDYLILPANSSGVYDIEISDSDFEDLGIDSSKDIYEAEIGMEIHDAHYNEIDSILLEVSR